MKDERYTTFRQTEAGKAKREMETALGRWEDAMEHWLREPSELYRLALVARYREYVSLRDFYQRKYARMEQQPA